MKHYNLSEFQLKNIIKMKLNESDLDDILCGYEAPSKTTTIILVSVVLAIVIVALGVAFCAILLAKTI